MDNSIDNSTKKTMAVFGISFIIVICILYLIKPMWITKVNEYGLLIIQYDLLILFSLIFSLTISIGTFLYIISSEYDNVNNSVVKDSPITEIKIEKIN